MKDAPVPVPVPEPTPALPGTLGVCRIHLTNGRNVPFGDKERVRTINVLLYHANGVMVRETLWPNEAEIKARGTSPIKLIDSFIPYTSIIRIIDGDGQ